jgi:hypothetical protein
MDEKLIRLEKRFGPIAECETYSELKDPCVVFDGELWHVYGSGIPRTGGRLRVIHLSAHDPFGVWTECADVILEGVDKPNAVAPGVVFDPTDRKFHMAIQEDFTTIGGSIEYLVSADGTHFVKVGTLLSPVPDAGEAGLYDPHLSEIGGEKYLVYAGMSGRIPHGRPFIPQPDIFLAKSTTGLWAGPYERIGKILDHDDIHWHHNRLDHHDYEWGIEGPQLLGLPDGRVLLNATCFLEKGERGTRQRVFFALAPGPQGPYESIGPVLIDEHISPASPFAPGEWEAGENGHASAILHQDEILLFYQARGRRGSPYLEWKYGIAVFKI